MIKLVLGALGWQGIVLAAAGIMLAVGGAYEVGHWRGDSAGRIAAQSEFAEHINTENDNAGKSAEKWRDDLRRCTDAGGMFDFATGACNQ